MWRARAAPHPQVPTAPHTQLQTTTLYKHLILGFVTPMSYVTVLSHIHTYTIIHCYSYFNDALTADAACCYAGVSSAFLLPPSNQFWLIIAAFGISY